MCQSEKVSIKDSKMLMTKIYTHFKCGEKVQDNFPLKNDTIEEINSKPF